MQGRGSSLAMHMLPTNWLARLLRQATRLHPGYKLCRMPHTSQVHAE